MKIIFKITTIFIFITVTAFAYTDGDFDGVSDALDQCPNSSIEDIVDVTGCVSKNTFSIGFGESLSSGTYGGTDSLTTYNTNVLLSYQMKKWYFSTAFSYFSSGPADPTITNVEDSKGFGDTYINVGYTHSFGKKSAFTVSALGNMKFATADTTIGTGEMDYGAFLSASYTKQRVSFLASFGYTITGDSTTVTYNDIANYSAGAGYMIDKKRYMSFTYSYAQAYLDSTEATKSLAGFFSYLYNDKYSLSLSYALGLSDATADHALSLMVTRKF